MNLFDLLQTMGGRLGILEAAAKGKAEEPVKVVTRSVSLEELKTNIKAESMQDLANLPSELTLPFEQIFEAAGIAAPAHGWNLSRLRALLLAASRKNLDRVAVQQMLLDALRTDAAPAEDLVREAVAQDQALDAFETLLDKKMGTETALLESRIDTLEIRMRELQSEREQLMEQMRFKREKLNEWRRRKRAYERDLASTIGYLTDHPRITTQGEEE